jgi:hypothetical protein
LSSLTTYVWAVAAQADADLGQAICMGLIGSMSGGTTVNSSYARRILDALACHECEKNLEVFLISQSIVMITYYARDARYA